MSSVHPPEDFGDGGLGNPFGGRDLMDALARWAAEARVDEAAAARSRERWLRQQAAEETTFASVVADLSERDRPVLVHTTNSRRHRGRLTALGVDFLGIRTDAGADVLVSLAAVTAIRTQPREQRAHSGRFVELRLHLADAVAAMAAERPRVVIGTNADDTFNGDLTAVGQDVVTLRIDGDTRASVYVPLTAIVDIALAV